MVSDIRSFSSLSLTNNLHILLVEDNSGDAELTRIGLSQSDSNISLSIVSNGIKALQFLQKEDIYRNEKSPDVILLDLNLPGLSGFEVLERLKADESMSSFPVVILTTSSEEKDIKKSIELGAVGFVQKSSKLSEYVSSLHQIEGHFRALSSYEEEKISPLVVT